MTPQTGQPAPARLRTLGTGLAVACLHLLGLWLWLASANRPLATPTHPGLAALTVWLQTLPAATVEEPRPDNPPQRRLPEAARGAAGVSLAMPPAPAATATPSSEGSAAPAQPAPPPTLNLALPRGTLSKLAAPGLAAQTPFHGRLPATVERQIEDVAAQSGPWIEEPLDYDHVRFRRGTTCVTMERPAAARIDPSNDALQRLPWLANLHKCP